jgi:hypothetical protein
MAYKKLIFENYFFWLAANVSALLLKAKAGMGKIGLF